jgi:hypothetical protein
MREHVDVVAAENIDGVDAESLDRNARDITPSQEIGSRAVISIPAWRLMAQERQHRAK